MQTIFRTDWILVLGKNKIKIVVARIFEAAMCARHVNFANIKLFLDIKANT